MWLWRYNVYTTYVHYHYIPGFLPVYVCISSSPGPFQVFHQCFSVQHWKTWNGPGGRGYVCMYVLGIVERIGTFVLVPIYSVQGWIFLVDVHVISWLGACYGFPSRLKTQKRRCYFAQSLTKLHSYLPFKCQLFAGSCKHSLKRCNQHLWIECHVEILSGKWISLICRCIAFDVISSVPIKLRWPFQWLYWWLVSVMEWEFTTLGVVCCVARTMYTVPY